MNTNEFSFTKDFNDQAARHVPLQRVSFGKNLKVQSEREFLLWHAACCLSELATRTEEFMITVDQLRLLRIAGESLAEIAETYTERR